MTEKLMTLQRFLSYNDHLTVIGNVRKEHGGGYIVIDELVDSGTNPHAFVYWLHAEGAFWKLSSVETLAVNVEVKKPVSVMNVPKLKLYTTTVLDESAQSTRVMDVPGYSHFSAPFTRYLAGKDFVVRRAYIWGKNKQTVQRDVKEKLGDAYWPSIGTVELYDQERHGVVRTYAKR